MQNKRTDNDFSTNKTYYSEKIDILPESGELICGGHKVRVSPNNMRVLKVLLKNPQQVVSRSEIFDSVWKNQIVSDDTLTRCISDLRSSLRSINVNKKLIETIPKLGYRWLAAVQLNGKERSINVDLDAGLNAYCHKETVELPLKNTLLNGRKSLSWLLISTIILSVILGILVWQTNKIFDRQLIRVALMPLRYENVSQVDFKRTFETKIKELLLETNEIRFLSTQAIENKRIGLYPYLSREYAIDWIIEGDISIDGNKTKITLNLVDARTALVEYSFTKRVKQDDSAKIIRRIEELIIEVKQSLRPN